MEFKALSKRPAFWEAQAAKCMVQQVLFEGFLDELLWKGVAKPWLLYAFEICVIRTVTRAPDMIYPSGNITTYHISITALETDLVPSSSIHGCDVMPTLSSTFLFIVEISSTFSPQEEDAPEATHWSKSQRLSKLTVWNLLRHQDVMTTRGSE
jgi:hypothetical protein